MTEILQHLDSFGLFDDDRNSGIKPFLLVDGHQSRFDLKFLEYINATETEWAVCIGVPYGTAFWQLGDSSKQNGTYKMRMTSEKKKLFRQRIQACQLKSNLILNDSTVKSCLSI